MEKKKPYRPKRLLKPKPVERLKCPERHNLVNMEIFGNFREGETIFAVVDTERKTERLKRTVLYSSKYRDLYFMWNEKAWLLSMFV